MREKIIEELSQEKPHLMALGESQQGSGEASYLHFYIAPKDVNYINRILEGYEYVGVMTSVDGQGHQMIRCTPDTRGLAIEILQSLGSLVKSITY